MEINLMNSLRGALARRRLLMSSSIDNNDIIYQLPKETTFNGVSDYINTGIKLFDVAQTFTLYVRADLSQGTSYYSPVFHCMYEQSPYYGLALQNRYLLGNGSATNQYSPSQFLAQDNQRIVVVFDNGIMTQAYYRQVTNPLIINENHFNDVMKQANLILGAYQRVDGAIGRYWQGTIYEFKIYDRVLSDVEINNLFI